MKFTKYLGKSNVNYHHDWCHSGCPHAINDAHFFAQKAIEMYECWYSEPASEAEQPHPTYLSLPITVRAHHLCMTTDKYGVLREDPNNATWDGTQLLLGYG